MDISQQSRRLPEADRLSTLAATILLANALARYIELPAREFAMQLPGFYLAIEINIELLLAVLVSGLTATGAHWLYQDHPSLGKQSTTPHRLLPALTALTVSLPLSQTMQNWLWWVGFALGGVLLILVLIAEYIVVDPNDTRYPLAAAGLTALSFSLYLVLAAALHIADIRLFLLFPIVAIAGGLVSLRTLNLRLDGRWVFLPAGLTALITGQIAAALHYWPISSVSFGLALLGPAYALTNFMGNMEQGQTVRQAVIEPVVVLVLVLLTAIWLR